MTMNGDRPTRGTGPVRPLQRPPLLPSERRARNRSSAAHAQQVARAWLRELGRSGQAHAARGPDPGG